MRRLIIIMLMTVLMIGSVYAAKTENLKGNNVTADSLMDRTNNKSDVNRSEMRLDAFKQVISRRIGNMQNRLQNRYNALNNSAKDFPLRMQYMNTMQGTISGFDAYNVQVMDAETTDELRVVWQEVKNFTIAQQKKMNQLRVQSMYNLGNMTKEKAEELAQTVQDVVKVMKVVCPEMRDEISNLENMIQTQEELAKEMDQMLQEGDSPEEVKAKAKEMKQLAGEMALLAKDVYNACKDKIPQAGAED